MGEKAVVLTSKELDNNDKNLIKLVEFCGVNCQSLTVAENIRSIDYLEEKINDDCKCLMFNASLFIDTFSDNKFLEQWKSFLYSKSFSVLIYNIYPDYRLNTALEYLSENAITSIGRHESNYNVIQIKGGFRDLCRQFSGLSFECVNKGSDFYLEPGAEAKDLQVPIFINNSPFFARIRKENCNLYLLANNKILDIDYNIDNRWVFKDHFSIFVPLLMFIKHCFGNECWSNKNAFASLIIDDPLLRERYGFLNYKELLELMDSNDFFTNIAFIPINSRRSDKNVARLLEQRKDRFKICPHGCNHTNNELGTTNTARLNRLIKQATKRMEIHKKLTGLDFDNVMVFPQGRFSIQAVKVLKSNGYLGAVNTTLFSVEGSNSLIVSDLLEMAVMRYHCFPIFKRSYPNELVDFAFDLFLGKPAIIVEHHNCFKCGYEEILQFVKSISSLDHNIKWRGLEYIIMNSYLEKQSRQKINQVKIYSGECLIENPSDSEKEFIIKKEECGDVPIDNININGKSVSYDLNGEYIGISTIIPPKTTIKLKINYRDIFPAIKEKESTIEMKAAWIRRYLSEFKDNYISNIEPLSSLIEKIIQIKRKIFR